MTEYKRLEEEIKLEPKSDALREADTRILIDRKLREAGWDIEDKNQVSTEEPTKSGQADYLLKDSRGRGLAILEAKRFSIDPVSAKKQALHRFSD